MRCSESGKHDIIELDYDFGGLAMECICSSCRNLKSVLDENDVDSGIYEVCEFGFVSEACETCELDGCALTCAHYVSDDEDGDAQDAGIIVKCARCSKEIVLQSNSEVGEVYCVGCYLNK